MPSLSLYNLFRMPNLLQCPAGLFVRRQCITDRSKRIAQLVGKKCEELILTAIGIPQGLLACHQPPFTLLQRLFGTLALSNVTRDFGSAHDDPTRIPNGGNRE